MTTTQGNEVWITESVAQKQQILHGGSFVVGVVILVMTYVNGASTQLHTSEYAAVAVGVALIVLAAWSFFMSVHQIVTVDTVGRVVQVVTKSRVRTRTKNIAFGDIETITLSELGDNEGGNAIYYVTVTDTRGVKTPLFFPAYFEGRFSRSVMEGNVERLKKCLENSLDSV